MRSKFGLAIFGVLGAAVLLAQDTTLDSRGAVKINFPQDSPVNFVSATMDESRVTARGAALVLDLHMSLELRNASPNRIHGVALRVVAQEVAAGGKASVAVPSLNIGPGDAFPVRIDLQLLRPNQAASGGPLVQVYLDGVLFQDFSFSGPDLLNSRRLLTVWETEAQRDREHFKRVLAQAGAEGLRKEMLASLARQADQPQLDVRVIRRRTVSAVAEEGVGPERTEQFAFLKFPDAPVEPLDGWAQIAGGEARAPRIRVQNQSSQTVKYVEMAWLVSDPKGQQYVAASLPASDPGLYLPPGKTAQLLQDTELRFSLRGGPVNIQKMTGFVSQVQFADGKVWVPNRQNLETYSLLNVVAPSAEEQRLTNLYRKKGLAALVEELKKF
ncbi:MAG: hypothetical protein LAP40_12145 [Acidobacteriia bacterium]|nr:hypothetical protein [Terriglobia bacterium]